MEVTTLKQALDQGQSHYFTGKPCKRGHLSQRRVSGRCCVDCAAVASRKWADENPEQVAEWAAAGHQRWVERNPERSKALSKSRSAAWAKQNPDRRAKNNNKHVKDRKLRDPGFRVLINLRGRLGAAMRGDSKDATTRELVGIDIEGLLAHLESQFTEGMSWDSYGRDGWHIDHIKPCALFDLADPEQQRECFHYTNLQPLWAEENLSKGASYIHIAA